MRRIFTVVMMIVSMMSFTSCRHNSETEIENVDTVDYVYRTEFEGHTYIMFKQNGWHNAHNVTGVVHDPDCKCFNR
jgi:hypothetical protein